MRRFAMLLVATALGIAACGQPTEEPLTGEEWLLLPASPLISAEPYGMSAYASDALHIWMEQGDLFVGAAYLPFDGAWVDLPDLAGGETAVAGSDQVFIWGWSRTEDRFASLRYDPVGGALSELPLVDLPATTGAAIATTDRELIVWGGALHLDNVGLPVDVQDIGAAYDWSSNTWRPLPPAPLDGRANAHAVWTGTELIVWGGNDGSGIGPRSDGAAYDPANNTWRLLAEAPAAAWVAFDATAVWTGSEMILWPGRGPQEVNPGTAYDPVGDTWRVIADHPGRNRRGHAAVWTGTEMIIYGGTDDSDSVIETSTTWLYDPESDSWRVVDSPRIEERFGPEYAWNEIELLVWGGFVWNGILGEYGGYEANGYAYIP